MSSRGEHVVRKLGRALWPKLPRWSKRVILNNVLGVGNPYTRYDDVHECIFIHVPKAAGISVSDALFGANIGHRRIEHFEVFDPDRFERYFKFAFVRNPWARAVSAYSYLKTGGRNERDKAWATNHMAACEDFEHFVQSLEQPERVAEVLRWQHFTPQWRYICDSRMEIKMDFVGRVEQLPEDFDYVKRRLDIEAELKHLNPSDHLDYAEYYTGRTRQIISRVYETDIELLGYEFA